MLHKKVKTKFALVAFLLLFSFHPLSHTNLGRPSKEATTLPVSKEPSKPYEKTTGKRAQTKDKRKSDLLATHMKK